MYGDGKGDPIPSTSQTDTNETLRRQRPPAKLMRLCSPTGAPTRSEMVACPKSYEEASRVALEVFQAGFDDEMSVSDIVLRCPFSCADGNIIWAGLSTTVGVEEKWQRIMESSNIHEIGVFLAGNDYVPDGELLYVRHADESNTQSKFGANLWKSLPSRSPADSTQAALSLTPGEQYPFTGYTALAVALYDYTADPKDPSEISFKKGEILRIVDKQGKWWQARRDDNTSGIAPSNYLNVVYTCGPDGT